MSEMIEVSQGDSVKRRKRKVLLVPETDEKPKEKNKNTGEPYIDPNAKPRPKYRYKKILLKPDQSESPDIDNVLNSASSIVRWDEKALNDGSILITIIYTERPRLPKEV